MLKIMVITCSNPITMENASFAIIYQIIGMFKLGSVVFFMFKVNISVFVFLTSYVEQ